MDYAKDSETAIDAELCALPINEKGILVIIQEETDIDRKSLREYKGTN